MVTVLPIDTPSLGDRSYLAHDGEVALVVDPQRDIDRIQALLQREGVRLTHVFETHIHNDYVTGGLALAEATGAAYHVNADDEVAFERVAVSDGDVIAVGDRMRVEVLATPGHTFTHLSYALHDGEQAVGVFTGGSLLFGSTGRPDLLGPANTDALVRHQWHSARRIADALPDEAAVLPTHGFGSFCSATQSSGDSSTIGHERQVNDALTKDVEPYVEAILAGLDAWPAYYAHMGPANAAGPDAPSLEEPARAQREDISAALRRGEWVVDLRTRTAFAEGHAPGTYNVGLDGQFATYLGWILPWGTPLTLLGETPEQVREAQRELVRIGIDRLEGAATGQPSEWTEEHLARFPRATFADLAQARHHERPVILDVRRRQEWDARHIEGAVHIPLPHLLERAREVPDGGRVWVHCAGGYRASIAASLLSAVGRDVVAVDDSFDNAADAGLPMA